jgi:hypothetical protein
MAPDLVVLLREQRDGVRRAWMTEMARSLSERKVGNSAD